MLPKFQFIDDLAKQLIQPKPCHYHNQQIWRHIQDRQNFLYQNIQHKLNCSDQRNINIHLIRPKIINKQPPNKLKDFKVNINKIEISINKQHISTPLKSKQVGQVSTCLIYLHGLSSFSMQGCFLINHLNIIKHKNTSICLYDMRGHGKDKAKNITFSVKQSQQLYDILLHLKNNLNYDQFILWGRSMGSTTILKMLSKYQRQIKENNIHIKHMILDSPFSSFQKVASELISKQIPLPTVLCKGILEYFLSKLQEIQNIKISVEINSIPNLSIPVIFLYSQKDLLISPQHTHFLFDKYSYEQKQKIQIGIGHNEKRPQKIVKEIFQKISFSILRKNVSNSTQNQNRRKSLSNRKNGIKLVKDQTEKKIQADKQNIHSQLPYFRTINISPQKIEKKEKFKVYTSQILQRKSINLQDSTKKQLPNPNQMIKGVQTYLKPQKSNLFKKNNVDQDSFKNMYQSKNQKLKKKYFYNNNHHKKLQLSHELLKQQQIGQIKFRNSIKSNFDKSQQNLKESQITISLMNEKVFQNTQINVSKNDINLINFTPYKQQKFKSIQTHKSQIFVKTLSDLTQKNDFQMDNTIKSSKNHRIQNSQIMNPYNKQISRSDFTNKGININPKNISKFNFHQQTFNVQKENQKCKNYKVINKEKKSVLITGLTLSLARNKQSTPIQQYQVKESVRTLQNSHIDRTRYVGYSIVQSKPRGSQLIIQNNQHFNENFKNKQYCKTQICSFTPNNPSHNNSKIREQIQRNLIANGYFIPTKNIINFSYNINGKLSNKNYL